MVGTFLVLGRAIGKFGLTRLTTAQIWGSHHLPPYNILYGWPWTNIQMAFLSRDSQMGVPKFPKLGLPWPWGLITLHANLRLRWGLKQSCSPRWELFNSMSHTTCTKGNQGDSWLLVVGNQIANLTPDPSFGHNLHFMSPNGLYKPISNIYILRDFQWYNKLLNPMSSDPCNCLLKIWESIWSPIPKMGVHLGVWRFIPSHFFAFLGAWNVTPGLPYWPTTLQALALIASPRLGLWHDPSVLQIPCWFHLCDKVHSTPDTIYQHLENEHLFSMNLSWETTLLDVIILILGLQLKYAINIATS
jgi:hypothetical protein